MSTVVPEEHREVLDAPYAVLTTLGRDGYPQSSMVSFLAEDGLVKLSLNTTRQKTRNLMARPRATLLIPDPASPYRTLEIRGDIELTPDEDYRFARHVGRKYGGTDFRYADRPGESRVGVVLRPVRINVTDLRPPPGS
ncbi:MAG TPA: TIGR03618 family F420-dependent PPOX class oxidoreductase [Actinomycetes bacterium]